MYINFGIRKRLQTVFQHAMPLFWVESMSHRLFSMFDRSKFCLVFLIFFVVVSFFLVVLFSFQSRSTKSQLLPQFRIVSVHLKIRSCYDLPFSSDCFNLKFYFQLTPARFPGCNCCWLPRRLPRMHEPQATYPNRVFSLRFPASRKPLIRSSPSQSPRPPPREPSDGERPPGKRRRSDATLGVTQDLFDWLRCCSWVAAGRSLLSWDLGWRQ